MDIGALGDELGGFVVAPAIFYKLDVADLPHLDRIAFDGYLTGLREVGWTGSAQLDETQRGAQELIFGHPVEEVASRGILIHQFLLRLADEAQQLIESSGVSST